jgi:hypothetical protein
MVHASDLQSRDLLASQLQPGTSLKVCGGVQVLVLRAHGVVRVLVLRADGGLQVLVLRACGGMQVGVR